MKDNLFMICLRLQAIKDIANFSCDDVNYLNIASFCDEIYDIVTQQDKEKDDEILHRSALS